MDCIALILAAGYSTRFNAEVPKQYMPINGLPLLRHVINAFLFNKHINGICVVINEEHQGMYSDAVKGLQLLPFAIGGQTRQCSARNGLTHLAAIGIKPRKVLIHDAARANISQGIITNVVLELERYDAVDVQLPVYDSVKRHINDRIAMVDRNGLFASQTPQGFRYAIISECHVMAEQNNASYTDDISLLATENTEARIGFVTGDPKNTKITTANDLEHKADIDIRIGLGYDIHRFSHESGYIKLGGIGIESLLLEAHSDGDVVLHALTDAILGAIGAGDIGNLFPDTDPALRGADSAIFVRRALDIAADYGYTVHNVDIVIIAQKPKIGLHRAAIRSNIAAILNIAADFVNIKATTAEGLGAIGREEGIAVNAVVLLKTAEPYKY